MTEQQKEENINMNSNKEQKVTDKEEEEKQIIKWVEQIKDPSTGEKALEELSHKRESFKGFSFIYLVFYRNSCNSSSRNNKYLSIISTPKIISIKIKQSLQCFSTFSMCCCTSRNSKTFFKISNSNFFISFFKIL